MPSLNVAEYIDECIQSAINQTLQDIEIICIDVSSTDGTREIINNYALADNRIKIIKSEIKSYGNYNVDAISDHMPETFAKDVSIWGAIYKWDFLIIYNIRLNETKGAAFQDIEFRMS